jgi:hypothetical protein
MDGIVPQQHCKTEGNEHIWLVIVYALMCCFGKTRNTPTFKFIDNKTFSLNIIF